MITAHNEKEQYKTMFSNGVHDTIADVGTANGGTNAGFNPHDLLEAAYASCINITVRMWAEKFDVPVTDIITKVSIDKSREGKTVFRYKMEVEGDLTDEQRERLSRIPLKSPIMHSLAKEIEFEAGDDL